MVAPYPTRKPGFFWQGLLVLLPVALLAGLGLLSLRHDRVVAQHDATARAQAVADALAPRFWNELAATNSPERPGTGFEIDPEGRLQRPPGCALTPVPAALDISALTPDQARLWAQAQAAEAVGPDAAAALGAYREFAASDPPAQFAAAAQYAMGLLLARQGDEAAARQCYQTVVDKYPGALAESGLPLEPLARLKLLELGNRGDASRAFTDVAALNTLCSNLVWNPTQLSREILCRLQEQAVSTPARDALAAWLDTWNGHELSRELFSVADSSGALTRRQSPGQRAFWFSSPLAIASLHKTALAAASLSPLPVADRASPKITRSASLPIPAVRFEDHHWLALSFPTATSTWYCCWPESEIGTRLSSIVEQDKQIPDYLGVGIDVAGKRLTWPAPDLRMWDYVNYFGRNGGGQKKAFRAETATNVLAFAEPPGVAGLVRASVFLTSPGALFAREQNRVFWVAALIAAAAAAAGAGFYSAYRAFHRQLRLSEMKSNFVSSVSHELRAPIASVRLMAESLERGRIPEPPKQREYFRFIVQECRRLSALVENVLDFSRIEQGRKQYEFEPTDLLALAEQTVRLMQTYAEDKGVRLELKAATAQPPTAGAQPVLDGKAVQQALVNLIDNAIKHSPRGQTVVVGLDCGAGAPDTEAAEGAREGGAAQATVLLYVEDNGEGIPPEEHEKIFERFYRRGSELRRETQGVGIGLSIVKHVVEAHGGRVLVRSGVGEGSRFTIELPAAGTRS